VTFLDQLSRRVRLRLWRDRQLDTAGIWLVDHGRDRLAILLWRAFGMWR
jgi:hypothetical protein